MNFSLKATKFESDEIIAIYSKNHQNFDAFYNVDFENVSIDIQHAELLSTLRDPELETFMTTLNQFTRAGEKINIELILNNQTAAKFKVRTFLYSVDYSCQVAILESGKISNRKMAGINSNLLVDGWNEGCTFYKDLDNISDIV